MSDPSIAEFLAERDAMLLSGDPKRAIAFARKHNPNWPGYSSPEVAEIPIHKARTAAKTLPMGSSRGVKAVANRTWLHVYG